MVRIGAVGDIHAPKFLDEFKTSIRMVDCSGIDLFLFAGDLIFKGQSENISEVLNALEESGVDCPVISCFGNEEYSDIREHVRSITEGRIRFLDDESTTLTLGNLKLGIVGSQGSLEKPTPWQAKNIPYIEHTYAERIDKIIKLLLKLEADIKILLTHYPPTYRVLRGERRLSYPHIGCSTCERIISPERVSVVICAHSHMGVPYAMVNEVPVYNVSLPAIHKITAIELSKIKTIDEYL